MFYKYVGAATQEETLTLFNRIVAEGSLKFAAALRVNDPFEFKFVPDPPPSYEQVLAWHAEHDPARSEEELRRAWEAANGDAWDFIAGFEPRTRLLQNSYVLSLAGTATSPLMWSHYTRSYTGFVVQYDAALIAALRELDLFEASGPVTYADEAPRVRFFSDAPDDMVKAVYFTKARVWSYEGEYRVVANGAPGHDAIYLNVSPSLIKGVILGGRAGEALKRRALEVRESQPGFEVSILSSEGSSYGLLTKALDPRIASPTQMF